MCLSSWRVINSQTRTRHQHEKRKENIRSMCWQAIKSCCQRYPGLDRLWNKSLFCRDALYGSAVLRLPVIPNPKQYPRLFRRPATPITQRGTTVTTNSLSTPPLCCSNRKIGNVLDSTNLVSLSTVAKWAPLASHETSKPIIPWMLNMDRILLRMESSFS